MVECDSCPPALLTLLTDLRKAHAARRRRVLLALHGTRPRADAPERLLVARPPAGRALWADGLCGALRPRRRGAALPHARTLGAGHAS